MLDLVVDVARCFASMAIYDAQEDRYDINLVMGPDEFHVATRDSLVRGFGTMHTPTFCSPGSFAEPRLC